MSIVLRSSARRQECPDFVFPQPPVVNLGRLVVLLANCLPHVSLGVLLQSPIEDEFFALRLGEQVAGDCFYVDLLRLGQRGLRLGQQIENR
jgi:hypothetical protein